MTTEENDRPTRIRSGITLNLITNSDAFRTPKKVGHPQIALTFTNQVLGRSKLFRDRKVADEKATLYPHVDIHLVVRVGDFSRKFDDYLEEAITDDDKTRSARDALRAAETELQAVDIACQEHFAKVPGFAERLTKFDAAKREIKRLVDRRNQKRFLTYDQKKLLRESEEKTDRLDRELMDLRAANPAPVDLPRRDALRKAVRAAQADLEDTHHELRKEKYAKKMLRSFLGERGIPNLPEKVFDAIAKGDIVLYELELSDPPVPTDRRGVPMCTRERKGVRTNPEDGATVQTWTEMAPCSQELSIPWSHVLKAMEPANLNQAYMPGSRRSRKKHFVYAPIDRTEAVSLEDPARYVDSIVIGALPVHDKEGDEPGWAVIIRKKQWVEVVRNIDVFRASGLLEQLLTFWPDASHNKLASQTVEETDDDEGEAEAATPTVAGSAPVPAAAPVTETRPATDEPVTPSAVTGAN
ncbi:MAG TPA: hypothetical protein VN397_01960 [Candidatus Methylomirabilis sp.]|nr:hypothetical protein [Candidatus Methylomirabilis sp.]